MADDLIRLRNQLRRLGKDIGAAKDKGDMAAVAQLRKLQLKYEERIGQQEEKATKAAEKTAKTQQEAAEAEKRAADEKARAEAEAVRHEELVQLEKQKQAKEEERLLKQELREKERSDEAKIAAEKEEAKAAKEERLEHEREAKLLGKGNIEKGEKRLVKEEKKKEKSEGKERRREYRELSWGGRRVNEMQDHFRKNWVKYVKWIIIITIVLVTLYVYLSQTSAGETAVGGLTDIQAAIQQAQNKWGPEFDKLQRLIFDPESIYLEEESISIQNELGTDKDAGVNLISFTPFSGGISLEGDKFFYTNEPIVFSGTLDARVMQGYNPKVDIGACYMPPVVEITQSLSTDCASFARPTKGDIEIGAANFWRCEKTKDASEGYPGEYKWSDTYKGTTVFEGSLCDESDKSCNILCKGYGYSYGKYENNGCSCTAYSTTCASSSETPWIACSFEDPAPEKYRGGLKDRWDRLNTYTSSKSVTGAELICQAGCFLDPTSRNFRLTMNYWFRTIGGKTIFVTTNDKMKDVKLMAMAKFGKDADYSSVLEQDLGITLADVMPWYTPGEDKSPVSIGIGPDDLIVASRSGVNCDTATAFDTRLLRVVLENQESGKITKLDDLKITLPSDVVVCDHEGLDCIKGSARDKEKWICSVTNKNLKEGTNLLVYSLTYLVPEDILGGAQLTDLFVEVEASYDYEEREVVNVDVKRSTVIYED